MRRSSKVFLAICAFSIAYVLMVYLQVTSASRKDFKQPEAVKLLNDLAVAFQREDVSATLSFAWEDADVAGQDLTRIRSLLHSAFGSMKDPKVEWRDIRLLTDKEVAHLSAVVSVTDTSNGQVPYPAQRIGFKLERRKISYLLNLVQTFDWRIAQVEGNVPSTTFP